MAELNTRSRPSLWLFQLPLISIVSDQPLRLPGEGQISNRQIVWTIWSKFSSLVEHHCWYSGIEAPTSKALVWVQTSELADCSRPVLALPLRLVCSSFDLTESTFSQIICIEQNNIADSFKLSKKYFVSVGSKRNSLWGVAKDSFGEYTLESLKWAIEEAGTEQINGIMGTGSGLTSGVLVGGLGW